MCHQVTDGGRVTCVSWQELLVAVEEELLVLLSYRCRKSYLCHQVTGGGRVTCVIKLLMAEELFVSLSY